MGLPQKEIPDPVTLLGPGISSLHRLTAPHKSVLRTLVSRELRIAEIDVAGLPNPQTERARHSKRFHTERAQALREILEAINTPVD